MLFKNTTPPKYFVLNRIRYMLNDINTSIKTIAIKFLIISFFSLYRIDIQATTFSFEYSYVSISN